MQENTNPTTPPASSAELAQAIRDDNFQRIRAIVAATPELLIKRSPEDHWPLIIAIQNSKAKAITTIFETLSKGTNPYKIDSESLNIILSWVTHGDLETLKALFNGLKENGQAITYLLETKDENGYTTLYSFVSYELPSHVEFLLQYADANQCLFLRNSKSLNAPIDLVAAWGKKTPSLKIKKKSVHLLHLLYKIKQTMKFQSNP